jgi:hypothetical protein
MLVELAEATCDPSDTPTVGALMDSAPAVSVKLTGVEASAAVLQRMQTAADALARKTDLRISMAPMFASVDDGFEVRRLANQARLNSIIKINIHNLQQFR